MNFATLLDRFMSDDKVGIALLLVALDFLLGVVAAVKRGNFRLAYVADFARNDILFKLVPYFVIYAGAILAGNQHFLIDGLDLGLAAGAFYATIIAAWIGSIGNSLLELQRAPSAPQTVATVFADENAAPPKD